MIWGVGTGRCGTKSLAVLVNGEHEGFPGLGKWVAMVLANEPQGDPEKVKQILRHRLREGKPSVDYAQSYVMDWIEEIDPDAEFIALFREPVTCIESMLRLEWWSETDQFGRFKPRPMGAWPDDATRLDKAIWHWSFTNQRILAFMDTLECPVQFYDVRELRSHEHIDTRGTPWCLTAQDVDKVVDATAALWARLQLMFDAKI